MSDHLGALRTYLLATAGVTALLADAQAVYVADVPPQPGHVQQAQKPNVQQPAYVVLHGLGDPGHYHLDGVADVYNPLVQVESWAPTSVASLALADAVDTALRAYRGALDGSVRSLGCFRRDRRGPVATDTQDGGERPLFVVQADYEVWRR
jgi:hypothetical protein